MSILDDIDNGEIFDPKDISDPYILIQLAQRIIDDQLYAKNVSINGI
jgi:hypothetical protein